MPREQLDLVLGHLRRVAGPVAEEELTDALVLSLLLRLWYFRWFLIDTLVRSAPLILGLSGGS